MRVVESMQLDEFILFAREQCRLIEDLAKRRSKDNEANKQFEDALSHYKNAWTKWHVLNKDW